MDHHGEPGKPGALVWAVAFNPSGEWIASASGDGTVSLWDVASGGLLQQFTGDSGAMTALAFSPDGLWLAAGGLDAAVRIWRLADG